MDVTNGASEGEPESPGPASRAREGAQTLADREQTLADSDQTLSDADQTSADSDQTSAASDQAASDRDQAASDRDLAWGGSPHAHEFSRDMRQRSTHQRAQTRSQRDLTDQARLDAGRLRDAIAQARDLAALARDQIAAARDRAMAQREADDDSARALTHPEITIRAARHRAAKQRAQAAEDRARAAEDRHAAAQDREQAARERLQALADCDALKRQLALTATDSLTGARTRTAGLSDLDRELDHCRRTGGLLVLAYVDVVGLKAVNDTNGHIAGDILLRRVIDVITEHLRPYDLLIRVGGDEFVCAMPNITMAQARRRFRAIATALASAPGATAIRTGFAQPTAGESATELIARADSDLLAQRRPNHDGPQPAQDTSTP